MFISAIFLLQIMPLHPPPLNHALKRANWTLTLHRHHRANRAMIHKHRNSLVTNRRVKNPKTRQRRNPSPYRTTQKPAKRLRVYSVPAKRRRAKVRHSGWRIIRSTTEMWGGKKLYLWERLWQEIKHLRYYAWFGVCERGCVSPELHERVNWGIFCAGLS